MNEKLEKFTMNLLLNLLFIEKRGGVLNEKIWSKRCAW